MLDLCKCSVEKLLVGRDELQRIQLLVDLIHQFPSFAPKKANGGITREAYPVKHQGVFHKREVVWRGDVGQLRNDQGEMPAINVRVPPPA